MITIQKTILEPLKVRKLQAAWSIEYIIDYTFRPIPSYPTQYGIKQNIWKAKRARKYRIEKVENSCGALKICPRCDGLGYPNYNFTRWCKHCRGIGIVDWIYRVRG